jgi:hypothetical protein
MRRSPKPAPSKTRVVGYTIDATFDETTMERLLADAVRRGVVTQYDTGRGSFCWFNGPPGEGLRAVRRAAEEIAARREPK